MNDQEEKNRSDSFMKEQYAKGEEAAENEAKKKKLKKQIITIIAPILAKMIVILVLIATVFGALILFTGFYEFILDDDQEDASKAKKEAVVLELSPKDAPSDSGTSKAKVVMDTNGSYDITTDYIDEDIANIRKKIDQTGKECVIILVRW